MWFKRKNKTKQPEQIATAPKTVRTGFFSTDFDHAGDYLNYDARVKNALARTFQRTHSDLVAVDVRGNSVDFAMDDYGDAYSTKQFNNTGGFLPVQQLEWYGAQGFIGWQLCAMLSQNWLIDKVCTMPGKDAVRNWFEMSVNDGDEVETEIFDQLKRLDKKFKLKKNCIEFIKMGRVFGIRHALFLVDGIDYSLPFNIDGVKPGSYKGITQIDPYWIAPELDRAAAADVASPEFYNPTWWRVNGQRVHRSHFVIMRNGDDVPDVLKPTYFYGGIPVPQKIYERVYAAERTANEAPMLAMTKRLTVLKMDTTKAIANPEEFASTMQTWMQWMNNYGVKVIDGEEEIDQYDTNLTGLDETIMTQYQLVAASGNVPATKLLGTTPKGFNATGEYEENSYHEELESIQENELNALIERHHQLLMRSIIAPKNKIAPFSVEINWNAVNSPSAKEVAEINDLKASADDKWTNAGAIDSQDVRSRIVKDKDSGYNGIQEKLPPDAMMNLGDDETSDPFAQKADDENPNEK